MSNLCGGSITQLVEIGRWTTAGTYSFTPDFDGDILAFVCGSGGRAFHNWGTNAKSVSGLQKVTKGVPISVVVGAGITAGSYATGNLSSFGNIVGAGGSSASNGNSDVTYSLGEFCAMRVISNGILTPFGEHLDVGIRGYGDFTSTYPSTDGGVIVYRGEVV